MAEYKLDKNHFYEYTLSANKDTLVLNSNLFAKASITYCGRSANGEINLTYRERDFLSKSETNFSLPAGQERFSVSGMEFKIYSLDSEGKNVDVVFKRDLN